MPTSADRTIEYRIKAVDDASRTFKNLEGNMKSMKKEFLVTGVAIGAFGAAVAKTQFENARLASRVDELGIVMDHLGEQAGFTTDQIRQQEDAIKKQGITTRAARQIMVQMAQAQLDMNDASRLARIAQDAAVIAQTNSSDAAEKLVFAISSGNFELLRNLGLYQNLNTVYKEFAKTLGKNSTDLTEMEKRQARLNSVIESGQNIVGVYEKAMGSAGKQMRSLERLVEEFKVSMGEELQPALAFAVEQLTALLKALNDLDPSTKKFVSILAAIVAGLFSVSGALLSFGAALAVIGVALAPAAAVVIGLGGLVALAVAVTIHFEALKDMFLLAADAIRDKFAAALDFVMNKISATISAAQSAMRFISTITGGDLAQNIGAGLRGAVQGRQSGGIAAGLVRVGERGPETVVLPRGSRVVEAGATRRGEAAGRGSVVNVSAPIIGTVFVSKEADETRLASKIEEVFTRMIQLQNLRAT